MTLICGGGMWLVQRLWRSAGTVNQNACIAIANREKSGWA